MLLVWIGIIAIVSAGIVLLVLQQRGVLPGTGGSRHLPPVERTVFTLEIGDIVQYMDTDWVVEGRLTYEDKDYTWFEYLLQDGERIRWLSVDEDDRVEVALLEPTTQLEVSQQPPKQITFAGETYRCVESGRATMTRIGTTLRRTGEHCRYFDYQGSNDQVLSIEDWNGEIEVTVGQRINPRMLMLLPGDGSRVYRN
ncbi:DUF4178 domain-containing protein [Allocoleopsis franciscana]|uniref:DUF4178 domain-containing protein n=1 Tax=Allocoleopsis franciscana PCC 7113 TaxID=1173027 RepID=K9WMH6_9CYAN|nr:DUF4178 domain-containing protein [Allocoleopsis franciscana]AFZ21398.1 hypothetical protein Mic7113_5773 [Allocoleopsis franciscana PCC 7113]